MKSYLRFLGRNKLYTAIEVVGLSIALAFVIILGAVLIDKSQVNDNIKDADDIYSMTVNTDWIGSMSGTFSNMEEILPTIPQGHPDCQHSGCSGNCLPCDKAGMVRPRHHPWLGLVRRSCDTRVIRHLHPRRPLADPPCCPHQSC